MNDEQAQRRKEYQHQWYLKNREKVLARVKEYKKQHPEQKMESYYRHRDEILERRRTKYAELSPEEKAMLAEKNAAWREANAEKVKQQRREYYLAHKEEINARGREYQKKNRARLAAKARIWRLKNRGYVNEQNRVQRKITGDAHQQVHQALRNGRLEKRPCEMCGAVCSEAHHDDYNFPLKVRWLCRAHHQEWHKNNKPIYKRVDKSKEER